MIQTKIIGAQLILDFLVIREAVTLDVFYLLTLSSNFSSSLVVASPLRLMRCTCWSIYSSVSLLLLISMIAVKFSSSCVSRCRSASISAETAASCCSSSEPTVPISFQELQESSLYKFYLSYLIALACLYSQRYSPYSLSTYLSACCHSGIIWERSSSPVISFRCLIRLSQQLLLISNQQQSYPGQVKIWPLLRAVLSCLSSSSFFWGGMIGDGSILSVDMRWMRSLFEISCYLLERAVSLREGFCLAVRSSLERRQVSLLSIQIGKGFTRWDSPVSSLLFLFSFLCGLLLPYNSPISFQILLAVLATLSLALFSTSSQQRQSTIANLYRYSCFLISFSIVLQTFEQITREFLLMSTCDFNFPFSEMRTFRLLVSCCKEEVSFCYFLRRRRMCWSSAVDQEAWVCSALRERVLLRMVWRSSFSLAWVNGEIR